MARASLFLPVQGISVRLTPNDIRAMSAEIESEAWYEAQNGANPYSDRSRAEVEEASVALGIDLRPRGAHARSFA